MEPDSGNGFITDNSTRLLEKLQCVNFGKVWLLRVISLTEGVLLNFSLGFILLRHCRVEANIVPPGRYASLTMHISSESCPSWHLKCQWWGIQWTYCIVLGTIGLWPIPR